MGQAAFVVTWFQKHAFKLLIMSVALIAFGAGWQLGRLSSPYYAAHPIVFEDRPCDCQASSGGTSDALKELQAQSTSLPKTKTSPSPPEPTVAAATSTAESAAPGNFVASKLSNLYHHISCPSVKRIKAENQVWFETREAAEAAGLAPSKCTQEFLGR